MYLKRLEIGQFRCFERADITLNVPGDGAPEGVSPAYLPGVNLFLGHNGAGKSSVFKAAGLAILGPALDSSGFRPDYLVRRLPEDSPEDTVPVAAIVSGVLSLCGSDEADGEERFFTTIERFEDAETCSALDVRLPPESGPGFFVAGYSANRRSERPEGYNETLRTRRYQRVAGLFEDHVGLVPFANACQTLKDLGRDSEARVLLNGLLPEDLRLTDTFATGRGFQFAQQRTPLPFGALSDGLRTLIGWVWDLLYHLALVAPTGASLDTLPGVLMVDEIDLFLHPEWQQQVVADIARTFPKLQLLVSTHSPLVAGTLDARNVFVLDTDIGGATVIGQLGEGLFGKSANQILTSGYFGLSSSSAPDSVRWINDLALRAGDSNEDKERFLRVIREGIRE